jgi:hypothetical protein
VQFQAQIINKAKAQPNFCLDSLLKVGILGNKKNRNAVTDPSTQKYWRCVE